jgi:ADP-heptose:LPS heptosyltransferase
MEWSHLVIVKPGALGDTLLLAPVLRAVRICRPGLPVTVIGNRPAVDLLMDFGVADTVFPFEQLRLFMPPRPGEPNFENAAVMAFIRGDVDGVDPFASRGALTVVRRPSRPGDEGPHVVPYLHECLKSLFPDLPSPTREPFSVPPLSSPPVDPPYMVLAPGAGGVAKQLPLERFVAMGEEALRRGISPMMIVGDAEVERGLSARLPTDYPCWISAPLPELAALLAGCRRYVGNDSGPGHLAGLVGAETTIFFGPTRPEVWAPWGPNVTIEGF